MHHSFCSPIESSSSPILLYNPSKFCCSYVFSYLRIPIWLWSFWFSVLWLLRFFLRSSSTLVASSWRFFLTSCAFTASTFSNCSFSTLRIWTSFLWYSTSSVMPLMRSFRIISIKLILDMNLPQDLPTSFWDYLVYRRAIQFGNRKLERCWNSF